jgi:site-specific recombinase XerD
MMQDDIERFIGNGLNRGWAPKTVANYRHHFGHVVEALQRSGCERWADVGAEDLDAVMTHILQRGMAKKSRIQVAILLKGFFKWLRKQGFLLRDPARALPLPHDGEVDLPPAPLSEVEVASVLQDLPRTSVLDLRNVCFVELLYSCGLRISEAAALRLETVDLTQRCVMILHSKHAQSRVVPLMPTTLAVVQDYLAVRRSLLKGPDRGHFLLSQRGDPWDLRAMHRWFDRLNVRRGPEAVHLHPHAFRHAIAVHLLRGGADIRYIQEFLGHSSLDTTRVYLRLVPGQLREDYDLAMPDLAL